MKFFILAVGNKMPDWITVGYNEYAKRMPREIAVNLIEIKPEKRTTGKQTVQLLAAESQRIRQMLPADCYRIVLDEAGQQWTTVEFAAAIQQWTDNGTDIVFVIGGADGLHDEVKQAAHQMIALSKMTLPHGLVRILLAEQLYRAASIIKNHPYHRA
ncbi:MAG: 23S rRNA (pseudouridine(1915)-N(3))-methyltransferase RlmH [Nitrosomonas sp.]|nr:MAG: 23S rRNA (pseudouridine(1915)-N(3))-methyltransferase RlmH [Nitrosomonas sp.]